MVKKTTALTAWDQRLADLAKQATKTQAGVGGTGNFLSIRGGLLSYQGVSVPENKMRCIIIDSVLENQWFDQAYDPDSPASPACYAFGREKGDMAPDPEQVTDLQHETCAGCPQMEFGSADRGKGKACHACQRLALITEGDLENIEDAQVAYLKLPFFSTLEYAAYTRQLSEVYHKPTLAFITEITVVPDAKAQFKVKFKVGEEIEAAPKIYDALWKKYEAVSKEIMFPYPKIEREEVKRNGARRAAVPARAVVAAKSAAPMVSSSTTKVGVRKPAKASKF